MTQRGPPRGPVCIHLEPLAPGSTAHLLPAPWSQATTSPPPSEAREAGAWLGRLLEALVTDHCTRHRIKGALSERRLHGRACRAALEPSQPPFPARPNRWGARRPQGAVDGEQEFSRPQLLLPAATKGRPLGDRRGAFPEGRKAQRGQSPWMGTLACSADSVPPASCLE